MSSSSEQRVFISYAHDDLPQVRKLYADLKARAVNVWMDEEDIGPGRWKNQIQKAIAQSRYFLFCMSKAALQKTTDGSGFIDDELQWAYQIALEQDERRFTIVPVRLEDVERGDHRLSVFEQYDLFKDWDLMVKKLATHFGGGSMGQVVQEKKKSHDEILTEGLFGKALTMYYANDLAKALPIVEAIISLSPDNINGWTLKAGLLSGLKRYEEALAAAEKGVCLNPNDAGAWYVKANVLGRQGRFQEALDANEKSLSLDADDYMAWFTLAGALSALRRHEDSLAAFERSLKLNPGYAPALAGKGVTLAGLERHEEALAAFEQAEQINPVSLSFWKKRKADVLRKLGRLDEALVSYEQALAIEPQDASIWAENGKLLVDLGRTEQALMSFERALTINPDHAAAWTGKSRMLFELKRYQEALEAYDQTLRIVPHFANAWYWKGRTLKMLGKYKKALVNRPFHQRAPFVRLF